MTDKLTLIHLISGQTMQNLLPALALRPNVIVEVFTPQFVRNKGIVIDACRSLGNAVASDDLELSSMPEIAEARAAILASIEKWRRLGHAVVVNFTGATKLISIGAWQAALESRVPSVYVATETNHFIDGETGSPFPFDGGSFAAATASLSVDVLALTNGLKRVSGGMNPAPYFHLSDALLNNISAEEASWNAVEGAGGVYENALGRGNRKLGSTQDCYYVLDTPVRGLPTLIEEPAIECGLLEVRENEVYLSSRAGDMELFDEIDFLTRNRLQQNAYRQRLHRLANAVAFPLNFLAGGWLEVSVAKAMQLGGILHDVRWSAGFGGQGNYELEEDVVGLKGGELVYVSCKRGNAARLLAHTEEINARAARIGGKFTKRYYVIHNMPYGGLLADLRKRCDELDSIQLVSSDDLRTGNPFA